MDVSYQWEHQLCTEQQRLPRKQALDSLQLQTDAALHKSRRRVECFPQRCIIVRCVSRTSLVHWPCQNLDVTKPETRDMLGACVNCEESGDNSPSTSELRKERRLMASRPGADSYMEPMQLLLPSLYSSHRLFNPGLCVVSSCDPGGSFLRTFNIFRCSTRTAKPTSRVVCVLSAFALSCSTTLRNGKLTPDLAPHPSHEKRQNRLTETRIGRKQIRRLARS